MPKKIFVYRITHIDNIPHILKYGITHKNSQNANTDFVSIGDNRLINIRDNKEVEITNGTDEVIEKIILGDFIPFYFGLRMPMLYVIQHGGNFVSKPIHPEEIVYLACSLDKILELNQKVYFSDGHATDRLTIFYNKEKIKDIKKILDWNAIKSKYWGGEKNLDLKRKKQAELLVKGDIKTDCIVGYACYNEKAKNKLIKFGISEKVIKIAPEFYF